MHAFFVVIPSIFMTLLISCTYCYILPVTYLQHFYDVVFVVCCYILDLTYIYNIHKYFVTLIFVGFLGLILIYINRVGQVGRADMLLSTIEKMIRTWSMFLLYYFVAKPPNEPINYIGIQNTFYSKPLLFYRDMNFFVHFY